MPGTVIPPARTRRRLRKCLRALSTQSAFSLFARRLHGNALLLVGGLIVVVAALHGLHLLGSSYAGPGRLTSTFLLAGLMGVAALEAAVEAWWRRLGRETVARRLDATLGLDDRIAAAWSCLAAKREDAVADALVLRATERASTLEPSALYPVRHQRYVWYVLLAAILLILLLPYGSPFGLLPLVPGNAETGPIPTTPVGGERAGVAETARAPDPDADPETPAEAKEPAPPREIETEVYPELPSYPKEGPAPMTARVRVRNEDPRPVAGKLSVRLDDGPFVPLPGTIEIPGGREFDRLRAFDLRQAVAEAGGLGGGDHRVQVAFEPSDGSEPTVSEPVEIFVESGGDSGGGGGENEQPPEPEDESEPEPEPPPPPPPGGEPPPPEPPPSLLVKPLFREGETVRKVGPTLQFDPAAPRGDPPRARPLSEVFPELRRRAEDAVSRDEIPPEWRRLVRRYFDLIRPK